MPADTTGTRPPCSSSRNLNEHADRLKGKIVLIHQHAEEYSPGGARPMIEDGCLDGVDVIFGTHCGLRSDGNRSISNRTDHGRCGPFYDYD